MQDKAYVPRRAIATGRAQGRKAAGYVGLRELGLEFGMGDEAVKTRLKLAGIKPADNVWWFAPKSVILQAVRQCWRALRREAAMIALPQVCPGPAPCAGFRDNGVVARWTGGGSGGNTSTC
jgi:hypothetical protein